MMKDLLLDEVTHDLTLDTDLALVEDAEYVAQKVKIRLWFFLGEWFLDTSEGVPYWQLIFVKGSQMEHIIAVLKDIILTTTGVTGLASFAASFDRTLRKLSVTFEAKTEEGTTGEVSLEVP